MMVLQEVKKIFEKKRVFLIAVLGVLFYVLFFRQNIGMPDYISDRGNIKVSKMLQEEYGNEIDREEYSDLQKKPSFTEESNIDAWIRENEDFGQYGIENYGDLLEKQELLPDGIASSFISQVSERFTEQEQQEALDNVWVQKYMENLMLAYDAEIESNPVPSHTSYYAEISEDGRQRIAERNQEEVYSIMPDRVMRNYLAILPDFAIFLFLSVILLTVPYGVKDSVEGVNVLQYASKKGSQFYWRKIMAALIGSAVLCAAESGIFMIMISRNEAFSFKDCFVSGFQNPFITFLKLTFGEYITLSMAYIIIMALCLSMVTYCLSNCAHNYVSAIAVQIPLVVFGIAISLMLMPHFAEIVQNVKLLFILLVLCFGVALISNIIRFISIKFYEQI